MKLAQKPRIILGTCVLFVLACCSPAAIKTQIDDPVEPVNRVVHKVNRGLDKVVVRPVSKVYGVVPQFARSGISNFASNLRIPGIIVNDVIQVSFLDAASNSARFIVNTTVGIGGLFDPASRIGLSERSTDFGETLHIWGVNEGAYVELPVFGPSTVRDAAGRIVDFATNPLNVLILPKPDPKLMTTVTTLKLLDQRGRFSELIDSIYYESEDSYSQAKSLYLQRRRNFLRTNESEEYFDPYIDVYGSN